MAKQGKDNKLPGLGKLVCRVITPQKSVFARRIESAEIDTTAGRIEVFARFESTIAPLTVGVMTTHDEDGTENTIAVHGGYMDMNGNNLVILADSAEVGNEVDVERARQSLARAKEMLAKVTEDNADKVKIDVDRAKLAIQRALMRLKVAGEPPPPGAAS